MSDDFKGSIAQQYISFSAITVQGAETGENYYSVVLFAGDAEAGNLLVTAPAIGDVIELSSSNFAELTKGALLTDLTAFYAANSLTKVYVVIYDDALVTTGTFVAGAVTALTTQFNLQKHLGYFKLMTLSNNIPAHVALATLCDADTLLSKSWIPANDAGMLLADSVTSMYAVAVAANTDPVIVYHPTKNGALAQLGMTLGALNGSGTPVGNSVDYIAMDSINPSGTAGANLDAASVTVLTNHKCGFFLTVGDGTGNIALKGGKTIKGNLPGAQWVVQYINYMSATRAANYLTQLNRFRNNSTYRAILNILVTLLTVFEGIGRLSGTKITAPAFANLPASAGDAIIIPNAWEAYFNDGVRTVQVQGTLYIS